MLLENFATGRGLTKTKDSWGNMQIFRRETEPQPESSDELIDSDDKSPSSNKAKPLLNKHPFRLSNNDKAFWKKSNVAPSTDEVLKVPETSENHH
jgi:hypothetical protein